MLLINQSYFEIIKQCFITEDVIEAFDLLGDLGGVIEVIIVLFGFMIYPISEHSFMLKATKKFFKARTT